MARGITRDSSIYPMADTFLPDRWMDARYPTFRDPLTQYPKLEGHSQFGNGRRICMGVDIVNHELLLVCGALAWAFNISKKVDENGREIAPNDLEYCNLLIAKPDWFPFDLTVRHEVKRQRIMEMWEEVKLEEGHVSEKFRRSYGL